MTKLASFSTTASDNGSGVTGVNFAEGQLPSTVNNSAREVMAIIKSWLLDNQALTTGGTSTAYTVTTNQSMATPADGDTLCVRWNATCGATPTLAVDGGTARTIVHANGEAVAAGDFIANGVARLTYRLSNTTWYAQGGNVATTTTARVIAVDDATTNGVTDVLTLRHTTTGTAANGIGTGLVFQTEDGAGNTDTVGWVRYVSTDVTNGSEDGYIAIGSAVAGTVADVQVYGDGKVARTGGIKVEGTNTNDSAAAGYVGQIIDSTVLIGSSVSLTTGTAANVTSISLTAGDWDVWGNVGYNPAGGTTISSINAAINTTSATLPTPPGAGAYSSLSASITTGAGQILSAGTRRISLSGTTTVYLIANAAFGVSTMGAYGYIGARRVR